jgi:hypothetical protein
MKRTTRHFAITTALAIALVGCNTTTEETDETIDPIPETTYASLRVLHLSPDAPAVDVFLNEATAVSDLSFASSTAFLQVETGTYDVHVSAAGSPASEAVLSVEGITLDEDMSYTAVAFDFLDDLQAMLLSDDLSALDADMIRVRAIHAAPSVGQVDIWEVSNPEMPLALYENVDFGAVGGYLELPVGPYTLGFDLDDDASPDVTFELPVLPGGTVANVFATQDAMGAVHLQAQLQDSVTARVDLVPMPDPSSYIRVLHLSRDAGPVDIFADGAGPVVEGLGFATSTDYLELPASSYTFDVVPSGKGVADSVLAIQDLPLTQDTWYTAVAYGDVAGLGALALVDDYAGLADGDIRVRAIHAAPIVGEVDIWEVSDMDMPVALYENVPFGAVGAYLDLPAGAYTLGFDVNDDATPDVIFDLPALEAGTVANVFAAADSMNQVHLLAQLDGDVTARIDAR